MADVAKQINNPVADIRALNFQLHRDYLQGEATDRTCERDEMNFQPVLPIHRAYIQPAFCPSGPVRQYYKSTVKMRLQH